jgi:ribosome-binding ATPase YchF (GTP1/OBG family)
MSEEERTAVTTEKKLKSMLPKIKKTGYEALQLVHYFTAGPDEVSETSFRFSFSFSLFL